MTLRSLCIALLAGAAAAAQGGDMAGFKLTSPAFEDHGGIPVRYTHDGSDLSPPLAWTGAPAGTRSFALIEDDPDAPDPAAPQTTWVHWVVYDIPASVHELGEGAAAHMPDGSRDGLNDWEHTGYGGPAPPVGRHRYFHKLYALDVVLPDLKRPDKAGLEAAMQGHVLGQAVLMGTYEKQP